MSYNPKLEFFRFTLNHKDKSKTFRDFAVECLGVDKSASDTEVFQSIFKYFMSTPETGFADNDQLRKVLTWIDDKEVNIHYDKKPRYPLIIMFLQELLLEESMEKMEFYQI